MKRILIAIAVVFCAQVAFQTYLAVERTDIDFYALSTPLRAPVAKDHLVLADLAVPEPQQIELPTIVRMRYVVREQKAQPSYAAYRRNAGREIRPTVAVFKPVIITVPSRPITASYAPEPKREKRSLPSKAAAVIKKPYDWLKAVASKLK